MVKLTCNSLKFLTKNDFRVLVAIEMGMKNHDLVPMVLINSLANLKFGGCFKSIEILHKHKLIYHQSKPCMIIFHDESFSFSYFLDHGYRLTFSGYDYLALKTFTNRDSVNGIGNIIGVGKESSMYSSESRILLLINIPIYHSH
jgi:RIO kinase 2